MRKYSVASFRKVGSRGIFVISEWMLCSYEHAVVSGFRKVGALGVAWTVSLTAVHQTDDTTIGPHQLFLSHVKSLLPYNFVQSYNDAHFHLKLICAVIFLYI